MEKTAVFSQRLAVGILLALLLCLPALNTTQANNPHVSNLLTNLSMASSVPGSDDYGPELIIEGEVIHALWTTWVGNEEGYLFYSRSPNLGDTWETPKQIYRFKNGERASSPYARRLAVSGSMVYIAICDNHSSIGKGYIYLVRSSDGGASFTEPTELANSGVGYNAFSGCYVRVVGNKVAIVYLHANSDNVFRGLYCLFSSDQGATFNQTSITTTNTTSISDMLYDGNHIVVLHSYAYYYYGLNDGRVYVSVSADDGASFTTHKISLTIPTDYGHQDRCLSTHDLRYVAKLAKDGNHIHAIFTGHNKQATWSVLYARSTNNGLSFEEAVDINNGYIPNIQDGQETVVATAGNVYMAYLSNTAKVYLVRSADHGATIEAPSDMLTANTAYVQWTWWPQLLIDPNDRSGRTLYFGAGAMMTRKSTDGGENFSGTTYLAPFLANFDVRAAALIIGADGRQHWLGMARQFRSDYDIFYGKRRHEPQGGTTNKAYRLETWRNEKYEASIVPSSPNIEFTETMTGEAWVKMLPGSDINQGIFAKINSADGEFYNGTGYHIFFDDWNRKRRFTSGVITDKGNFINWTDTDVRDTLWHHVAFTYDANGGQNNLKSYLDGILVAEQTATGNIIPGDGLLLIGSRQPTLNYTSDYMIDDIRLWDRALSQEELIENQVREFTGEEEGLKLWLNFDDTFKDMSGNGNDAIPVYLGELTAAGFDPPKVAFDMYKTGNQLSFTNKTVNASQYSWDFGNSNTSILASPQLTYANPGEYLVSLKASNPSTMASAVRWISVEGLERVEPKQAGNYGFVTLTVHGGGLTPTGTALLLRKSGGETEIAGSGLYAPAPGQLAAQFLMDDAALGDWDVVVKRGDYEQLLPAAFQMVQAILPEPWVSLSGRGAVLLNMWQSYTISYGNKGNVDALSVPLNLVVSDIDGLDLEMIDFKIEPNAYMKQHFPEIVAIMDTMYVKVEDYFGIGNHARFYPLVIPLIEANATHSIRIRLKSPVSFQIECWVLDPMFYRDGSGKVQYMASMDDWPDEQTKLNACIALSAATAAQSIASDLIGMVLPIDCVNDIGMLLFNPWDAAKPDHKRSNIISNNAYSIASAVLSCASDLTPYKALKIAGKVVSAMNNMYAGYKAHQDCLRAFDPRYKNQMDVNAVSSFDPNEMVGPGGYGDENHIAAPGMMPYTVLFENKPDATAPAHIVTITDTLDLAVFDLASFGFTAFGWGDTLFSPPGSNLREFSADIDMRPALPLITRVSARLDTLSGVVSWEFLSLNPETMDLEEDPFVGFLPPNATSPEGEGFVSFFVGLRSSLTTGSRISNQAEIVFDANEPILTNIYINTIDLIPPESSVNNLEPITPNHFMLRWAGSDQGSGISHYTIYVMENDTLLYPWLVNTMETSAIFSGVVGSTYQFYSIAADHVGHLEADPAVFDARTTLTVNVPRLHVANALFSVYPNPARGQVQLVFSDMASADVALVNIYSMSGALVYSRQHPAGSSCNIDIANLRDGVYVVKVSAGMQQAIERLVVAK